MRLRDKYQVGNNKYLLKVSSNSWHNKNPTDSIKRLKLLLIDKIVSPKIEGATDHIIIKNLIFSGIELFGGKFKIAPQYNAPKNVNIIDP